MLYLISTTARDYVKLGYSINPQRRLKQLQTASAEELILIATCRGSRADENQYHHYLSPQCQRGEWFYWCDKIDLIILKWSKAVK